MSSGDIGPPRVLGRLETIAPVQVVRGNVDRETDAGPRPLFLQLQTPVGRIGVTHGHLPDASAYDTASLIRHFQPFDPAIIVFGHTHVPTLERRAGVVLLNPGAAGRARLGRGPSVGLITLDGVGQDPCFEIKELN